MFSTNLMKVWESWTESRVEGAIKLHEKVDFSTMLKTQDFSMFFWICKYVKHLGHVHHSSSSLKIKSNNFPCSLLYAMEVKSMEFSQAQVSSTI